MKITKNNHKYYNLQCFYFLFRLSTLNEFKTTTTDPVPVKPLPATTPNAPTKLESSYVVFRPTKFN